MAKRVRPSAGPTGWRRVLFRAPVKLYRWHLGWLFGSRFCLPTHTGRSSGLSRQTVLEVVGRDPETGAILVASGFGQASQWYRNICHDARVHVRVGRRSSEALARPFTPDESGQAMALYASRHPRAALQLLRLCGLEAEATAAEFYQVGHDFIPFVALTPTGSSLVGELRRPTGHRDGDSQPRVVRRFI
ncbi:nitroreductase family deazaflavin-dependent oxidoreductase [Streptacidiphilus rugosus]|uniref:nitroreductase family deazaflavin-dependent oxidoreductase n=1 Tax=Streptacidiphilus rugosus TaxID=405783 RepID=UPI000AFBC539|nr:nitroreductase family deazaflavin-dependent oxidoreductase [Streptacidiphilus rugosus]